LIENVFKVGDYVRFKTLQEFIDDRRAVDPSHHVCGSAHYRSVPVAMQRHLCGEMFHISEVVPDRTGVNAPYYHTEERVEYRRSGGQGGHWFIDDGMLVPAEVADDTDADDIDVDAWGTIL